MPNARQLPLNSLVVPTFCFSLPTVAPLFSHGGRFGMLFLSLMVMAPTILVVSLCGDTLGVGLASLGY